MRKMKDSGIDWIGMIPYHWTCCKQKYLITLLNGRAYKDDEFEEDGKYKILRVGNLFTNPVWYTSSLELEPNKYCQDGDLLYSWSMSYAPVIWHGEKVIYHYHIWKTLLSEKINKMFAYYYLISLTNALQAEVHETTMGFITMGVMNNAYIAYPTFDEQKKIADFLDEKCGEIDSIRADVQRQIELLNDYKKSVITETVTKGLNPKAKLKDSGIEWIGKIPEHWLTKKIKYLTSQPLQYGANESGCDYDDSLPRYIRITDISMDNKLKDDGKLSLEFDKAKPYLLEDDDLLFARSGASVGKTFLYKKEYGKSAFAGYLIKASIDKTKAYPKFVYYNTLSNCYDSWKQQVFTQATIQNIGAEKYNTFVIPVPPLSEQKEIANYLDDKCTEIDAVIADKQKQLETLDEYKKSLIFEYVTGKKEVAQ